MIIPQIRFQSGLTGIIPEIRIGIFVATAEVTPSSEKITAWSDSITSAFRAGHQIEDIHSIQPVADTRMAYKKLGKDPSRYRPSAEALMRRIINGKSLYRVNNIVDILNTISVESGISIGGYDIDRIQAGIELGIGNPENPYEAIGRGPLNITGLPALFDASGPFGTPTSDSVRTMITGDTQNFMLVFFDFSGNGPLEQNLKNCSMYYTDLSQANGIETRILRAE